MKGTSRRWWTWPLAGTLTYAAVGVSADVAYHVRTSGQASPWGKGLGSMSIILAVILVMAIGLIPIVAGWVVAALHARTQSLPAEVAVLLALGVALAVAALVLVL